MPEVKWTQQAIDWLAEIHDYIANDSPRAAVRLIDGLIDRALVLERFPRIGHRYESVQDREVRILLHGHYRIAYLIISDDYIEILGVFHGAMDITKYLG